MSTSITTQPDSITLEQSIADKVRDAGGQTRFVDVMRVVQAEHSVDKSLIISAMWKLTEKGVATYNTDATLSLNTITVD